jgi:uncharacterized membrane protein
MNDEWPPDVVAKWLNTDEGIEWSATHHVGIPVTDLITVKEDVTGMCDMTTYLLNVEEEVYADTPSHWYVASHEIRHRSYDLCDRYLRDRCLG